MFKEIAAKEITDIKKPEVSGIKDIKPGTDITPKERDDYWKNNIFQEKSADIREDGYFNSYEDRLNYTPKENSESGSWNGERGESKFIPTSETLEGKAALEKLKEKGQEGIDYTNAEPDFSKCAEATVEIDNMTENRGNYIEPDGTLQLGNFFQADIKCAEKWNAEGKDGKKDWTGSDVNNWRHENKCSWHERCDTKTMDLVSFDIHSYCKHLGGVSECKVRDSINAGGEFDE